VCSLPVPSLSRATVHDDDDELSDLLEDPVRFKTDAQVTPSHSVFFPHTFTHTHVCMHIGCSDDTLVSLWYFRAVCFVIFFLLSLLRR
jgi:hypothetical protein